MLALIHFNHSQRDGRIAWPDLKTTAWKPNYGDMRVCAAILRQLDAPQTARVGFGQAAPRRVTAGLIRGSTYLHREFDFAGAIRTIESIDGPVAIVGLGAQNPDHDVRFLDDHPDATRFVALLAERGRSISARGAFTAEVLSRLGARDVRVTGCPSLFYDRASPRIAPGDRLGRPDRHIAITIHSKLSANIFCRAPREALAVQGELIAHALETAGRVSVFEQGLQDEHAAADAAAPMEARRAAAARVIRTFGAEAILTPDALLRSLVSPSSVEGWLKTAAEADCFLGMRFHGNIAGVLAGAPCVFYTYDTRLEELCDLYHFPRIDVRAAEWDPIEVIGRHDWERANQALARSRAELIAFYDENGVPHRL